MTTTKPNDIDKYIATFPKETQALLEQVRRTIKNAAPGAEEIISYQMPAFKLHGRNLIYFAGYANHISIYPAPRQAEAFKKVLAAYKGGKGTVQFPLNEPLPLALITRIVKYKAKENLEKAKTKLKKK